jgi:hypothetical protein
MLFCPVYIESHPCRNAAFTSRMNLRDTTFVSRMDLRNVARAVPRISSNSFTSYLFRTLALHLKTTVSSNPLGIKRFRTLCKIPGIGYPLSPLATRHSPLATRHFSSIPFIFSRFRTLVAQWSAATPVFSDVSGLFPLQWGCISPSPTFVERLFPFLFPELTQLPILPESFDPAGRESCLSPACPPKLASPGRAEAGHGFSPTYPCAENATVPECSGT